MKVPYDLQWFTTRDVAACLGVSRATLLRMINAGRFPKPDRHRGQRALWCYGVVSDKIETQLRLWLGWKVLAEEGYKPLRLQRPRGMSRRSAEKMLEQITKQTDRQSNRRYAPRRGGGDELAKVKERERDDRATRMGRWYAQACQEAGSELGRHLTVDERMSVYKRMKPSDEELRRVRQLVELTQGDYTTTLAIKTVIYSEPEAVIPLKPDRLVAPRAGSEPKGELP